MFFHLSFIFVLVGKEESIVDRRVHLFLRTQFFVRIEEKNKPSFLLYSSFEISLYFLILRRMKLSFFPIISSKYNKLIFNLYKILSFRREEISRIFYSLKIIVTETSIKISHFVVVALFPLHRAIAVTNFYPRSIIILIIVQYPFLVTCY